jgi:hypothetical protein
MEYPQFERRMLDLMFRTNVPLTPVHLAYHLDISIALARQHLDYMVTCGILELDSDEHGYLLYVYPMRPPLSELDDPPPPPMPIRALEPIRTTVVAANDEEGDYNPAAAAALSLFLPGVGQIYSGRVPQGVGWMLATGLGYLLFLVPGLILHICCIVNAAAGPPRLQKFA